MPACSTLYTKDRKLVVEQSRHAYESRVRRFIQCKMWAIIVKARGIASHTARLDDLTMSHISRDVK